MGNHFLLKKTNSKAPSKGFAALSVLLTAALLFTANPAWSGNFSVSPIRLEFDQRIKTGSVTVNNESDKEQLTVQMRAFLWTQDAQGKDVYEESKDLLFFPRIATINANESRVIRAGFEHPLTDAEKTYRLFIEEIPEPRKDAQGAQISVTVRFGVPVFVKPQSAQTHQGEITSIVVEKGQLLVTVKNTGNSHFLMTGITAEAGEFSESISGWYLLTGAMRTHTIKLPPAVCKKGGPIKVFVRGEKINIEGAATLNAAQCGV